jgi:hypothetical protein
MASARARQILNFVPKVLAPLSLTVWFSFIYLTFQYDATRPTVRKPEQGRVYGLNNHGHVVYLTAHEQENLNRLELVAVTLFAVAFLIGFSLREAEFVGEIRAELYEKAYGFTTAARWYALGRNIQRGVGSIGPSIKEGLWHRAARVEIRTEDSISECRDRLVKNVYLNPMHISGAFNGKKLHLYVVRENFRNSFAPHFYGTLEDRPVQTTLAGRFGMHLFVRIFLGVWFGFFTILEFWLLTLYVSGVRTGQYPLQNPHLTVFLPLAFIICGLLMVHWGKNLGKNDQTRILEFLERSIGAHARRYF